MTDATDTKFLGLELNKYMKWKNYIEKVLQKKWAVHGTQWDPSAMLAEWLHSRWFVLLKFT